MPDPESLHLVQNDMGGMGFRAVQPLIRFFEIARFGAVDIHELLRIPVDQRKPAALNLNHNAMPFPEGMEDIRHPVFNLCDFSGDKGLRIRKAVSEFPAKQFSSYQLLETAHPNTLRIGFNIGYVVRIHIDQFYNEIGIGATRGDMQAWGNRARDGDIPLKSFRLIRQHIGAA